MQLLVRLIASAAGVLLGLGCTHVACTSLTDPRQDISARLPVTVIDPLSLSSLISNYLEAHCSCNFPANLRKQVTFGNPGSTIESIDIGKENCIGPASIVGIDVDAELPSLVAVSVETARTTDRYIIIAVRQNKEWFVYWPEKEDNDLH